MTSRAATWLPLSILALAIGLVVPGAFVAGLAMLALAAAHLLLSMLMGQEAGTVLLAGLLAALMAALVIA